MGRDEDETRNFEIRVQPNELIAPFPCFCYVSSLFLRKREKERMGARGRDI